MGSDGHAAGRDGLDEPDVVSAVDGSGASARFVVADIARDGAWVSVTEREAAAVADWR